MPETRIVDYLYIDIIYPTTHVLSYTLNLTDGDSMELDGNILRLKRAEDDLETEIFLSQVAVIEKKFGSREETVKPPKPKTKGFMAPGSKVVN